MSKTVFVRTALTNYWVRTGIAIIPIGLYSVAIWHALGLIEFEQPLFQFSSYLLLMVIFYLFIVEPVLGPWRNAPQ